MSRLSLLVSILFLAGFLASGPALAADPAGLPGWAPGEPELHVVAPDGHLLLVNRSAVTGEPDRFAAAVLLAEARNPGLLAAFGRHLLAEWAREGLVREEPGGRFTVEAAREGELEARLRLAVALELRPYLRTVLQRTDRDLLEAIALGLASPLPGDVAGLRPFSAPWYAPTEPSKDSTMNREVTCGPCGPGEVPSVFCGEGLCVDDCPFAGHECLVIDVPGLRVRVGGP